MKKEKKIAVLGLGYVGLPLLICISKKFKCVGYDINKEIINELGNNLESRNILTKTELKKLKKLKFTNSISDLKSYNVFIITVPTPIDKNNEPDLSMIISATNIACKVLKKGDLVIYESTVYPGVTEEICVPIIENKTNLKLNKDFYCGYSPERVNPGDDKRTIEKIVKVTSGSNKKAAKLVDDIYNQVINAGTYMAESIKIAEMSKVIENTQRDLNIGLMNEIALICNKLKIDTNSVLSAAKSKWNFLDFYPGLVGGHCISVDPYYLTFKSKQISYNPELILAARKMNDNLPTFIANQIIQGLIDKNIRVRGSKLLILGITFKENVSDIRNSKIITIIKILLRKGIKVNFYDPMLTERQLNVSLRKIKIEKLDNMKFDSLLYAVDHEQFRKFKNKKITNILKKKSFVYDIRNALPPSLIDKTL